MQKTFKYTCCYIPVLAMTVVLTQETYAATRENVTDNRIKNYEIWKASSNNYSFMQFISDVFTHNEQLDTNKEAKLATPPTTENSPSTPTLQTYNQSLIK